MARMCLAAAVEPGHASLAGAVAEFGAAAVWTELVSDAADGPLTARARTIRPGELAERTAHGGQRFVIPGDDEWPPGLADLAGCEPVNQMSGEPLGLWVRGAGHLGELTVRAIAMVGSRASSAYGDTVASEMAAEISDAGRAVLSGGAYGIDAAAHRGCLTGRTPTLAVLACGLDQAYPCGHAKLFERITEAGVLVSELPPGEHPTRVRFLARNRLIAAMTGGTVMVEAAVRSGARNTVTWANTLNRVVMAVPGPVTSATSVTPHRLIREAEAVLVTNAAEVLEMTSPLGRPLRRVPSERRPTDELAPDELRLFELVPGRGSIAAGELAVRAGMSMLTCLALLGRLADAGFVIQDDAGRWRLPPRETRMVG